MEATKIKLCGLSRPQDILAANALRSEYIGFVFAPKSPRYVSFQQAGKLKELLEKNIQAVGVFVKEKPEIVAELLNQGVIDLAQLHGGEDEDYICRLRRLTKKPIIQAFSIALRDGPAAAEEILAEEEIAAAEKSSADYVLLDSGKGGTGKVFNWECIRGIKRPYFLAGGLEPGNVADAIKRIRPYGVDVSSGIETDGRKDEKRWRSL